MFCLYRGQYEIVSNVEIAASLAVGYAPEGSTNLVTLFKEVSPALWVVGLRSGDTYALAGLKVNLLRENNQWSAECFP